MLVDKQAHTTMSQSQCHMLCCLCGIQAQRRGSACKAAGIQSPMHMCQRQCCSIRHHQGIQAHLTGSLVLAADTHSMLSMLSSHRQLHSMVHPGTIPASKITLTWLLCLSCTSHPHPQERHLHTLPSAPLSTPNMSPHSSSTLIAKPPLYISGSSCSSKHLQECLSHKQSCRQYQRPT